MELVESWPARGVLGTGRHRRPARTDPGAGPFMVGRAAPTLLGAQTAQPGKQTQSFSASLSGGSQTHLPSRAPHRSDPAIPQLERPLAARYPQSRGVPGERLGRVAGLLGLSQSALETPAY